MRMVVLLAAVTLVAVGCGKKADPRDERIRKLEARVSQLETNLMGLSDARLSGLGMMRESVTNQSNGIAEVMVKVMEQAATLEEVRGILDRLLASATNAPAQPASRQASPGAPRRTAKEVETNSVIVWGKVTQRLGRRLLVNADSQFPDGVSEVSKASAAKMLHLHAKELGLPVEWQRGIPAKWNLARRTVLVEDYRGAASVADEDVIMTLAYPIGFYEYVTVRGSRSTIRKYTCDLARAMAERD